jgi:hypothetical protein
LTFCSVKTWLSKDIANESTNKMKRRFDLKLSNLLSTTTKYFTTYHILTVSNTIFERFHIENLKWWLTFLEQLRFMNPSKNQEMCTKYLPGIWWIQNTVKLKVFDIPNCNISDLKSQIFENNTKQSHFYQQKKLFL